MPFRTCKTRKLTTRCRKLLSYKIIEKYKHLFYCRKCINHKNHKCIKIYLWPYRMIDNISRLFKCIEINYILQEINSNDTYWMTLDNKI